MSASPTLVAVAAGAVLTGAICGASLPVRVHAAPPTAPDAPRAAPLFTAEGGPVVPGRPPRGLSDATAGECAGCHAEIAAEWAGSAHARSWTDPIFQAEYQLTPQAFCRHCHAPLAADPAPVERAAPPPSLPARDDAGETARERPGIDCAVCHVRTGHVLGVRGSGDHDHAALAEARLATGAFCGGCHQFNFPARGQGRRLFHPGQPLQNTVAEWQQSRYADQPCQSCHMPAIGTPGRTHRSHAFRTLSDPDALARAVRVTAQARRRGGRVEVAVEIAAGEIGHAFPTGDMFRRAVLTVRAGAAHQEEALMRYFAQTITQDGGLLLGQIDDTRVPPPGTGPPLQLALALDDARATEVVWSLELFRLSPDDARDRGLDAEAAGVPVRSGRIAIRPDGPAHSAGP